MNQVEVRHSEPSDAAAIKRIYQCKNAYSQTLQLPYPSGKVWEQRIGNIPEHVYSFVALIDAEIVGNLGLVLEQNPRRRHVATFGMGVHDTQTRKGVGSALLNAALELSDKWLNIRRIEITVYKDNLAAQKLYEKYGFIVEGESKDFAFRDGEFVDVYQLARVRN